jgi:hypothetical protein
MVTYKNWGLGLSPSPDPTPNYNICEFKYMLKHIYTNIVWHVSREAFSKDLAICGGPGFEPHGLHK